jgi:hypothetical protein
MFTQQNRFCFYETPNGKEIKIHFEDVEDIAFEHCDDRRAEDMDDESFYEYVEIMLEE